MSEPTSLETPAEFYQEDLVAARELLPPQRGELLRQWILRTTSTGLTTPAEARLIKTNNPEAWDSVYLQA